MTGELQSEVDTRQSWQPAQAPDTALYRSALYTDSKQSSAKYKYYFYISTWLFLILTYIDSYSSIV